MPTYEYRCPEGHEFERFQKMTDPPRARCPVCGKSAVRQISGGAGLIFKGSGFYITDYGKDGKGPRQDKESEAKPEPGKSEASPAADAAKPAKPDAGSPSDKPEKKSGKKKASS
ncbi:MAG TPA: zinc ribbon domain-containing protein [Gemmatimonadales bacterium]|nr:zinc ribbon domain-containing protein [Gemmatimonadales bacterium]